MSNLEQSNFYENINDDIILDLNDLKESIINNTRSSEGNENNILNIDQLTNYISPDIIPSLKNSEIPDKILVDFIIKFKDFYNGNKKLDIDIGDDFVKHVGGELEHTTKDSIISTIDLIYLFFLKKVCPKNYEKIFVQFELIYRCGKDPHNPEKPRSDIHKLIHILETYGDDTLKFFNFCMPDEDEQIMKNDNPKESFFKKRMNDYAYSFNFWEIFVNEEESINLFNYLDSNPTTLTELGGNKIKEIDLDTNKGINFCFRGILEMVKSRKDIEFPHLNESPTEDEKEKRKNGWKKIIEEYQIILRDYIAEDFEMDTNGKKIQRPREKTFDKIFYTRSYGDFTLDTYHTNKDTLNSLTSNGISEYGFQINHDQNGESSEETYSQKLLEDVKSYINKNPDEQILLCIEEHGNPDGSSRNDWNKEDWIALANLSPNIKIWSIRCFFGTAYENDKIYNHISSVSGYSNTTPTLAIVTDTINEASELGLGFHEMEIYTRLNYSLAVAPLTESMPYTNRETGEKEIGKVGLAQNNNGINEMLSYA